MKTLKYIYIIDLEESILNNLKINNSIDIKDRYSIARQLFTEVPIQRKTMQEPQHTHR